MLRVPGIVIAVMPYIILCHTTDYTIDISMSNGHEACIQILLETPHIDVTIQNKDGYKCLTVAALNRRQQELSSSLSQHAQYDIHPKSGHDHSEYFNSK